MENDTAVRQNGVPRVVVTGMGAITPLGIGVGPYWEGLLAARSGVRLLPDLEAAALPVQIAGTILDFEPRDWMPEKSVRRLPRFAQLAIAVTQQALDAARLELGEEEPTRVGVEMGNAVGSTETMLEQYEIMRARGPRRLVPSVIPGTLLNMASSAVAMHFGITGPGATPVAACATGLYAVGDALRRLQRGEVDVAIAGACESSLGPLSVSGFWRIGALSTRNDAPAEACRPFDSMREGTVMAEGAAALVLETEAHARARNVPIRAEVVGYGVSQDAFHMIAPDPDGAGAARAMSLALREAAVAPSEVDWISAHATATPLNDLSEARAIQSVFGAATPHVPVSGLKGATGHMLGAAGAASVVATICAIQSGQIPPTRNLHEPDPGLPGPLDLVRDAPRARPVHVALSNAFGFGGQNACIIVRRYRG